MRKEVVNGIVMALLSVVIASISVGLYAKGMFPTVCIAVCVLAMVGFVASVNYAFGGKEVAETKEEEQNGLGKQDGNLVLGLHSSH